MKFIKELSFGLGIPKVVSFCALVVSCVPSFTLVTLLSLQSQFASSIVAGQSCITMISVQESLRLLIRSPGLQLPQRFCRLLLGLSMSASLVALG